MPKGETEWRTDRVYSGHLSAWWKPFPMSKMTAPEVAGSFLGNGNWDHHLHGYARARLARYPKSCPHRSRLTRLCQSLNASSPVAWRWCLVWIHMMLPSVCVCVGGVPHFCSLCIISVGWHQQWVASGSVALAETSGRRIEYHEDNLMVGGHSEMQTVGAEI